MAAESYKSEYCVKVPQTLSVAVDNYCTDHVNLITLPLDLISSCDQSTPRSPLDVFTLATIIQGVRNRAVKHEFEVI